MTRRRVIVLLGGVVVVAALVAATWAEHWQQDGPNDDGAGWVRVEGRE